MQLRPFKKTPSQLRKWFSTHFYDIPERYRNSFFLANAQFFDDVTWYLHRAYEVCYNTLIQNLLENDKTLDEQKAATKVDSIIKLYDHCNTVLDLQFPVKRDNGTYELVRGYRVHHGLFSGFYPCLGGLRIKEDINRDHMRALAALSTYKHACMGMNVCGAHGGIQINPSLYTETEHRNIIDRYVAELCRKGCCGGQSDIFEPDVNTGSPEMSWIADSYARSTGRKDLAHNTSAVGKPTGMRGLSDNYDKCASQGAYYALEYFMNDVASMAIIEMTPGIKNKCFIVQGLGRMGGYLAQYLENAGAMCVGIKEHDGYIHDYKGLNVQEFLAHKEKHGTIAGIPGVKPSQTDDIYKDECDILIFAALQKSLMCYTAKDIKAKVILEAANGPIPPIAHKILVDCKRLVIPDIFACAGASVASYLEYLVNLKESGVDVLSSTNKMYLNILDEWFAKKKVQAASTSETKVANTPSDDLTLQYAIDSIMSQTGKRIIEVLEKYQLGLDIKIAAYIVAIENIYSSIYKYKNY